MGRRLRTTMPQSTAQLTPHWDYLRNFREADNFFKSKQKKNFDSRHRAKDLPQLQKDTEVWITSGKEPAQGTIVGPGHTPRSYVIKTDKGEVRRNRGHLKAIPKFGTSLEIETPQNTETGQTTPTRPQTRSQTGCQIKRPMKLDL
ncbi:uncharacterized protein LOC134196991 [Corticium candelabrum]|nr:uncharacterized protein LOC134196991 [Corticium candelabrum]